MMQVGLSAKDMLAREPDLTLYRQLSHYTLQVTFLDHLMIIFVIIVVKKIVEWKQCLTKGVIMYKPGQHLPDAEPDQVRSFENYHHTYLDSKHYPVQVKQIKVSPQMEGGMPVLAARVTDNVAPVFKMGSHRL